MKHRIVYNNTTSSKVGVGSPAEAEVQARFAGVVLKPSALPHLTIVSTEMLLYVDYLQCLRHS